MGPLLLILVMLFLIGGLPQWGYQKTYILPRYAPQPKRRKPKEGGGWYSYHSATVQCTDPWGTICMTCTGLVPETAQKGDGS
jgi:hypothetical protein